MKTTILALVAMVCGSVAFGHDTVVIVSPSQPQAVCTTGNCPRAKQNTCKDGKCRVFSVDEQFRESTRPRVLGGRVTRQTNRTVVKPVR